MILRRGITRTVFLTKRYAVKVPSLRAHGGGIRGRIWSVCRGWLANEAERTWWTNSHDPALCPVLRSWLAGFVQIYPRCSPLPLDENGDYLGELPVPQWCFPGDDKPTNFGRMSDGTIVRLDYDMNYNGCPHDRSGAQNRRDEDRRELAEK